jgi:hypothetical protein
MSIAAIKKEDIVLNFKDGWAQTELLAGVYPGVRHYRCVLKAGASITPETYGKALQVLCITDGQGCITAGDKVFHIEELSFFIPDMDQEYRLSAATDITITKFVVDMTDSDMETYSHGHIVLPFFRRFSDCIEYFQDCKSPQTRSWSVLVGKQLGRILFGVVKSTEGGTVEEGHPPVAQWNVLFEDSDITLTVENESIQQKTGDFSFVPAGPDHSLVANPGKTMSYIWFEHYVLEKDYIVTNPRKEKK